jgi:hypothetical protein
MKALHPAIYTVVAIGDDGFGCTDDVKICTRLTIFCILCREYFRVSSVHCA